MRHLALGDAEGLVAGALLSFHDSLLQYGDIAAQLDVERGAFTDAEGLRLVADVGDAQAVFVALHVESELSGHVGRCATYHTVVGIDLYDRGTHHLAKLIGDVTCNHFLCETARYMENDK